jgi:phosphoenolpyruvate-protein phosphotransferase
MEPPSLLLLAPLSGPLLPIEQVPDPVFSQKMVGDGVSIDPITDRLLSPCDGRVVQIHSAGHAITLAPLPGLEVLIHIGLDTVTLKGEGFRPGVRVGQAVTAGQTLIEFDADYVATHARSLLTEIVVTTSERVAKLRACTGFVTAGQDVVLELTLAAEAGRAAARPPAGPAATSAPIRVPNQTGLHARPAAVLASHAKAFQSEIRIHRGDQQANAKSVVAIMGLEVDSGDSVLLSARGPDAGEAVAALARLLQEGLGEEGAARAPARPAPAPSLPRSSNPNRLVGVAASPGLAVGQTFRLRPDSEVRVKEGSGDPHQERRALDAALEQAKGQLEALRARLAAEADAGKAGIFAAHRELLEDPDLLEVAVNGIEEGKSAAFAWQQAFTGHAARLAGLRSELLAGRANDVRDVGRRVLRLLAGVEPSAPAYPANTILLAEDLTPSDTATLDRSRVLGFGTVSGGASSHVAILARSLGIPALAGLDASALEVPDGTPAILDGGQGVLRLNPLSEEVSAIRQRQGRQAAREKAALAAAHEPAVTTDGHRVEVAANIAGLAEAEQAVALGAEAVGLLRSEFLFLDRSAAPSEEEQFQAYRGIAKALGPQRPLIVRTLDVGGDKPLAYLPIPREANPFLGERGIRLMRDRPEILRVQARAILRAAAEGAVRIMFPMIATLAEVRAAKELLEEERKALGAGKIPVGIMVEVASAALLAEHFAREVDFFSIGTNDLTQYTLAMDRGHPKLAPQMDGLDPSVLRLIDMTVRAAHAQGKWVGICGGIASDAQAVPLLVGLGVDELSVSVPTVPAIKARVRRLSLAECRTLAGRALAAASAAEVRALSPDPDRDS